MWNAELNSNPVSISNYLYGCTKYRGSESLHFPHDFLEGGKGGKGELGKGGGGERGKREGDVASLYILFTFSRNYLSSSLPLGI